MLSEWRSPVFITLAASGDQSCLSDNLIAAIRLVSFDLIRGLVEPRGETRIDILITVLCTSQLGATSSARYHWFIPSDPQICQHLRSSRPEFHKGFCRRTGPEITDPTLELSVCFIVFFCNHSNVSMRGTFGSHVAHRSLRNSHQRRSSTRPISRAPAAAFGLPRRVAHLHRL